jgi:hypothetical protein
MISIRDAMTTAIALPPDRVAAAPPPHPLAALLARYAAVFEVSWGSRHELAGPKRLADERAFLPAALALQDSPPHPAPQRLALALCALFSIAPAWSSGICGQCAQQPRAGRGLWQPSHLPQPARRRCQRTTRRRWRR